jgi:hypothetical protein
MLKYNIVSIFYHPYIVASRSICDLKLHNYVLMEFSFGYHQLIEVYGTYIS